LCMETWGPACFHKVANNKISAKIVNID
jgi:hypothetical protein